MYQFTHIYSKLLHIDENEEALYKITRIIYKYYLTPKEKTYFRCLELYYQDKKQRELSVLLNVDQPNLSAKFAKLRRKLRIVADFLLSEDMPEVLHLNHSKRHKALLTDRQYEILLYLLAGNKAYHISKHLKVSPVAIHQTITYLKRKLPPESLAIQFLIALGAI